MLIDFKVTKLFACERNVSIKDVHIWSVDDAAKERKNVLQYLIDNLCLIDTAGLNSYSVQ